MMPANKNELNRLHTDNLSHGSAGYPEQVDAPKVFPGVPAQDLIALRSNMLRFVHLQLRNAEMAEDMVQDAIEAT